MKDEFAGYKPGTVYKARVETGDKIYFKFSHEEKANHVDIMRSDSCGTWSNYLLVPDIDLHHFVPNGTWILHTSLGCYPMWLFENKTTVKKGLVYTPTITRAKDGAKVSNVVYENSLGGRHYGTIIEDDILEGKPTTQAEVKKAVEWYEKCTKKEVKSKMLQLIDVIFFNRKTKEIDFRKEIVAVDIEEAYMLAAQEYGKYNSKVHMRHANCLFSFVEDSKE